MEKNTLLLNLALGVASVAIMARNEGLQVPWRVPLMLKVVFGLVDGCKNAALEPVVPHLDAQPDTEIVVVQSLQVLETVL